MQQKITLKDVAQLAGVSVATVSYVLNRSPNQKISKETRARVREAARALSYMPNTSAQSLRSNRSGCIGVAINKEFTIPRYAQTLQGIRQVLEENGYQLMICSTEVLRGEHPDYLNAYFSRAVDGIIHIGADNKDLPPEMEEVILRHGIPAVVFDCSSNSRVSSVQINYFTGARDLVLYMADCGVRNIHYIRPAIDTVQERRREQGILRAIYERPELELTLHRMRFAYSGTNMQIYQSNFSETERSEFQEYAEAARRSVDPFRRDAERLAAEGKDLRDSAIICSWAGTEQHVCAALEGLPFRPRIGVLAQGLLFPGSYPYITYCELPNYAAGQACARQVLQLLENPEAITHTLLDPVISEPISGTD